MHFTFQQILQLCSLAIGEYWLDKDAHVASGRVPASNNTEPKALVALTLGEGGCVDGDLDTLTLATHVQA